MTVLDGTGNVGMGGGGRFYEFVSVFLDKATYETNSLTNILLYLTAVGSPLRKLKPSLLTLFRCYSVCTYLCPYL